LRFLAAPGYCGVSAAPAALAFMKKMIWVMWICLSAQVHMIFFGVKSKKWLISHQ
jgi:hypothetical protein